MSKSKMLKISEFNNEEIKTIEANLKGSKIYFALYFKLFAPLSFLMGLIGLAKKGFGYWPTTLAILIFFLAITMYLFIKENILYKRDLKHKQKYTGLITVMKKSRNRNDCLIYTDVKEVKKIDVLFFDIFDQIEVGDELYLEIALSSKFIFKLEKGILPLINGHQ